MSRAWSASGKVRLEAGCSGRAESGDSRVVRTLLILRHAKSGHDDGLPDKARTLTERGRKAAAKMGGIALAAGLVPDRVLCSTAERARETWAHFGPAVGFQGEVEYLNELYLAEPDVYLAAVAEYGGDAERVMIVGHNPGLEGVVTDLTGERVELPTAALVECGLEIDSWSRLGPATSGKLIRFFRPKDSE
jgi:phosphohistidine phosphatase